MGASHAAHHHGSRPMAKYCNPPDTSAAPTCQPRRSRRRARVVDILLRALENGAGTSRPARHPSLLSDLGPMLPETATAQDEGHRSRRPSPCRYLVVLTEPPGSRTIVVFDPESTEGAVKYLCLVYADEKNVTALSDREWEALVAENLALCDELRASGHFVGAAPLHPAQTAVTVRMRDGKLSSSDGPFAETKEQLGGYYLIE